MGVTSIILIILTSLCCPDAFSKVNTVENKMQPLLSAISTTNNVIKDQERWVLDRHEDWAREEFEKEPNVSN